MQMVERAPLSTQRDIFSIIGHPINREILRLIGQHERTVSELVENLQLTQPAISKHLRQLRDANLVEVRVDGQRRWYKLADQTLEPLHEWIAQFPDKAN